MRRWGPRAEKLWSVPLLGEDKSDAEQRKEQSYLVFLGVSLLGFIPLSAYTTVPRGDVVLLSEALE